MHDHSAFRFAAIVLAGEPSSGECPARAPMDGPRWTLASLAVLSQDILAVDPDAIVRTKAMMTVVGGKIVHRSGF